MAKKRFFLNHSKSSAMVVSLAIHAIIIVVALSFVAVKVLVPQDPTFEAKRVKRPKMPPKKIQVPVNVKKRKPKPRLRQRIVTQKKTFNDIKMPEITGVKGGLGNMGGDGLGSLGFDFKMDLFGGRSSGGNELVGTFFDLKQTKKGKPTGMNDARYIAALRSFTKSWDVRRLEEYFTAPTKKYATFFMIPDINADAAPKAYGVDNVVKPKHWLAFYTGKIAAPETGYYRFCGSGDDVLAVRVRKRLVLDAGTQRKTGWKSDDDNNMRYPALKTKSYGYRPMFIGDWFKLTKGKPSEIEVLLGEMPGGLFYCRLLIQKKGVEYEQASFSYNGVTGTRPVLPIFKTKEIPKKLIGEMRINPRIETLEGPSFGTIKNP